MTWQATLTGRVPSKKNSRITTASGRSFPSKAFRRWHEDASLMLAPVRPAQPLTGALRVMLVFDMKGRLDTDLDNMVSSVLDLLTDNAVIADDREVMAITAYKNRGVTDFRTFVSVEPD